MGKQEFKSRDYVDIVDLQERVNDSEHDIAAIELSKEDSSNITAGRKLSALGNFTGTWEGHPYTDSDPAVQETVINHTAQLAENTKKNVVNIFKHAALENTDITSVLNTILASENQAIDLMGGSFIVSNEVLLSRNSSIENGTLTISGNGAIRMDYYSKLKNISFVGNAMTNTAAIKVMRGHTRLYDLTFENVTTAIRVDASEVGFYNVKMDRINIKSCDTGIYMSSYGGWLTDISVTNAFIYFYQYGIYMTRGNYTDMSAKGQFSQCNIDNITFVDWHQNNDGVGIYVNAGWNNFNNLVFFYDGSKAYPFYAIKFDDITDVNANWDTIQCIRSNDFTNLTVEGYISKNAFYLNRFKNLKIINNFANDYPLAKDNNMMAQTVALGHIDTKVESLTSLTASTFYTKIGAYTNVTFSRENESIVIANSDASDQTVTLAVTIDPKIKKEMLKANRINIMSQVLIQDGLTTITQNDYLHSIITINESTMVPSSTVKDYVYNNGVITTKGRISNGCFFLTDTQKSSIANATDSVALKLNFKVKANSTVKIKDIKVFPYITTTLNESNIDWQNDYL